MGKIRMGILDGFVGKVGTVIGSFWKGKKVMRAYNEFPNDPNTEDQQLVRAKFKKAGQCAGKLASILNLTYGTIAEKEKSTPVGEFVKALWPNITGADVAHVNLPLDNLPISKGNLTPVEFDEPDFSTALTVKCAITNGYTDSRINSGHDQVFALAMLADTYDVMASDGAATRDDDTVQISVPAYWQGRRVLVYGFTKGYALGTQPNAVSDSIYIGEGTIR